MPKSPLPPACAARYLHQKELASGGYGAVHLAVQKGLDRPVVVKLLHSEVLSDPEAVARFENEARISAAIDSPHVAKLIEAGFDGVPWIVYEYLPGKSVRTLMFDGPLEPSLAVRITMHVLHGLAAAHAAGILHRDIKPENVLAAEGSHFKVTDFGIAKWTRDGAVRTRTGFVMGTPAYLPPEVITGAGLDARADLYSAGVMLHELLAGAPPFADANPILLLERHLKQPPPPLPLAVLEAEPGLAKIVARALVKDPADRFASADEMLEALSRLKCAVTPGRLEVRKAVSRRVGVPATGLTNSGKFKRRVAFALSVFAVLVGGGLLWGTLSRQPEHADASVAPRPPGPLTRGTLLERIDALTLMLDRLKNALPEADADDPNEEVEGKKRARRLKSLATRYRGAPVMQLRRMSDEADLLAPIVLSDGDLENVQFGFGQFAADLAYHVQVASHDDPTIPPVGAGWKVLPGHWIARLLAMQRAHVEKRKPEVRANAGPLRESLPAPSFERMKSGRGVGLVELAMDADLWHNQPAYVAPSPEGARSARDLMHLLVGALCWRYAHPESGPTRLGHGSAIKAVRLLTAGNWQEPVELRQRIQAFHALRSIVNQRPASLHDSHQLALAGGELLAHVGKARPPLTITFVREGATASVDWSGAYLEAVLAGARGLAVEQRKQLFVAARGLRALWNRSLDDRDAPAVLSAILLLEQLAAAHPAPGAKDPGDAASHAGCADVLALARKTFENHPAKPQQMIDLQKELERLQLRLTCLWNRRPR